MAPIRSINNFSATFRDRFGRTKEVVDRRGNTFLVNPGNFLWTAGVSSDLNYTTGDYTLTAQSPYGFTAYIWGAGGTSGGNSVAGAGGFASATFSGSVGDVYVLKSNFGAGQGASGFAGGGGYGIFLNSFSHSNSRLIAGGGGGGTTCVDGPGRAGAGGGGGGSSGQDAVFLAGGYPVGGFGGTQLVGGTVAPTNSTPGSPGTALLGGNAGGTSGGGGGGYYGGGGGGFYCCSVNGGGGGGSGFVHPSLSNPVNNAANYTTVASSPVAASPKRGTAGNVGQPGRIYLTL